MAAVLVPAIMKGDYRTVKSSDHEKVSQIYNARQKAVRAQEEDYKRGLKAWKYYFALPGDQWSEEDRAVMADERRYPFQFDILSPKINTMAGALIMDMPDTDWIPYEGWKTTGTEAIKSTYYSDKEVTNWDFALIHLIKAGLVHSGWVEMVETKKYHPLGNIGLEYVRRFIPSPYWKSNNDRDLKEGYKQCYFTPDALAFKYKAKSDLIRNAIANQKGGTEELSTNASDQRNNFEGKVGDEYEVIETLWLEIIKTERLVGRKRDALLTIPFPVSDDQELLQKFARENDIEWDTVNPEPYDDIVSHKTAICPSLDPNMILHDKKTRVQVRGLPIFHFTTIRHDGKDKGLAESIIDIQQTINKRVSLETNLIEKANGGSDIYNENLFTDEKKRRDFVQNKNKTGRTFFADLDGVKNISEQVGSAQFPSQPMTQIELMFDKLLPVVSQVSDAWSAQSSSGEAGILFERKVQMNKIGTLVLDKSLRQLLNNLGEAYFYQWQITYGDHQREVATKGGKETTVLNEQLEDGSIRNDVKYTPRCKVIVSENVRSATRQIRDRTMSTELLKNLNPETNPLTYQNTIGIFINSLDYKEDEMEVMKADVQLEKMAAKTNIVARIAQNTAAVSGAALQDKQAQGALEQMGAQQPKAQPAEQVTAPEEQIRQVENEPAREEEPILTGGEELL